MPPMEGVLVFELLYLVLSSNNLLLASPDAGVLQWAMPDGLTKRVIAMKLNETIAEARKRKGLTQE